MVDTRPLAHHLPLRVGLPPGLAHRLGTAGWLESPLVAVVLGALALAGFAGWWVLHRRSRPPGHRGLRWAGRGVALVAALLVPLTVLAGVNTYVGYVPTLSATGELFGGSTPGATTNIVSAVRQARSRSAVVELRLPTPQLGMPDGNAYVYVPAGYRPGHRYPVLYLLGGAPGNGTAWWFAGDLKHTADALIEHGIVRPMLIVVPKLNPTPFVDYEVLNAVHGPQIMTYLMRVVLPSVERHFSTLPGRSARAIAGFSAGADGALNVGLHHLATFGGIGAIEPEGWPGHGAWWVVAHDPAIMAANSPIRYLPAMRFRRPVSVYLSGNGAHEAPVRTLAAELAAHGQQVVVHDEFGYGHTWNDARADLPYLLQWTSGFFASHGAASGAPAGCAGCGHAKGRPPLVLATAPRGGVATTSR